MDEQQIIEFIKLILNAKLPQWWKDYAGQIAYNLQVHTKGLMFDKVTGLYPHEHPDSQRHCIQSYESITKGSIWKAINNIIRVFNNSSYKIEVSDKAKELLQQYSDKEGSFFSEFLEDWIRYAVATDPNGICVVYPPDYSEDLYRYVCYNDLVMQPTDEVLIFVSQEESKKEYVYCDEQYAKEIFFDDTLDGHPNVRHHVIKTYNRRLEVKYINKVYHVFTKTHFVRIFKDDPGQQQWQYTIYPFDYEQDSLPYFENGGVEIEYDVYESFVQSFVPFGNLALMSHRNQRATDLMYSYPRMSEVQSECDMCNGQGQVQCATTINPSGFQICQKCKGSKWISIQSPYKVYSKRQNSFDTDGKIFSTPSVEFYTPPTGIIDYNNKQWQQYLAQAEEAVFVQQKIETGNVEAAKSKEIDREGLYSWLANISKVLYGNLKMFLQYTENYVNASPVTVAVEQPNSLAILTESEAFDALNIMLGSNAPVPIKANQIDNFVNKFISESSPVKRALHILKKFDLLLYYSNEDVMALKGQGTVSANMVQQHTLAYPVLIQMYELDKTLFDKEDEQIIVELQTEIDKYDLTKQLKTNILNA